MATLHLFAQVLLLLLFFGLASCEDNQLVISVSENGTDEVLCLKGNPSMLYSCKTLAYVLKQISENKVLPLAYSILVNVTYNQNINAALEYKFSPLIQPLTVTVLGENEPIINCEPHSSLAIMASELSRVSWVWKKLVFSGCGSLADVYRAPLPGLKHTDLHSLVILDCRIMTTYTYITNTLHVVINSTEFRATDGTVLCPAMKVVCSRRVPQYIEEECTFFFSHNTFSNCQIPSAHVALQIIYKYGAKVNIINNIFSRMVSFWPHLGFRSATAILVKGGETTSTIIQKNTFVKNALDLIIIECVTESPCDVTFITQNNIFLYNRETPSQVRTVLILVYIVQPSKWVVVELSENQFIGNSELLLINILVPEHDCSGTVSMDNIIIINNTAGNIKGFVSVEATDRFSMCINNITAEGNVVGIGLPQISQSSIFSLSDIKDMSISNATFRNNLGTPIIFLSSESYEELYLTISGNLSFVQNTGLYGGAFAIYNLYLFLDLTLPSLVIFKENSALFGGAVYIQGPEVHTSRYCNTILKFINNNAVTAGNSVYFASNPAYGIHSYCKFNFSDKSDIRSLATDISFIPINNHTISLSIFPGQNIIANVSITDMFGIPSSCIADVYFSCNSKLYMYTCKGGSTITLKGTDAVVIAQEINSNITTVDTGLIIVSQEGPINKNISILLKCRNAEHTGFEIPLNITECPLGFVYNQPERVCKCAQVASNDTYICSARYGAACVSHGYWYGPVNTYNNTVLYTTAKCSFPECKYSFEPCPPELLTADSVSDFVLLGSDPNQQCSEGRGGVLCRGCAPGYEFIFTSKNCVLASSCSWWQPYLILFVSLMSQMLIAVLLILVVRFKLALGSGFLYGPMLFLAVVNHLPLYNYPEYLVLSTTVSLISATPLLNLELFSLVPWCFFPSFSKLYNYSLRYLGPLTVLTVILLLTFVARQCPNSLRCWQGSPLKAMCILMLLSFWSLADISVNILIPTEIISYDKSIPSTYMVSIQPDFKYFSSEHLPVAIPALLVLLVVITPLLSVLLLSPVLSKIINLYRIKPFLDEFQSCYEDKYRWYSGVYFVAWIIIVAIQGLSVPVVFVQTSFVVLMSVHFLIQPYQSRVLNIMDMLLLMDLNFLIALMQSMSATSPTTSIFIHALVLGPLLCIMVLFSCVCIIKCGVYDYLLGLWIRRRRHSTDRQQHFEEHEQPPRVPVQEVHIFEDSSDREPLIAIVNDE